MDSSNLPAPIMSEKVAKILRWAVGWILLLAGTFKVFPLTEQMAKDNLDRFAKFATVYPTVPLGYQPSPEFYLYASGSLEALFSAGLLFAPRTIKKGCCLGLMFFMTCGVQTLVCVKQPVMALAPAALLGILWYTWRDLNKEDNTSGRKAD